MIRLRNGCAFPPTRQIARHGAARPDHADAHSTAQIRRCGAHRPSAWWDSAVAGASRRPGPGIADHPRMGYRPARLRAVQLWILADEQRMGPGRHGGAKSGAGLRSGRPCGR